MDGNILIVDDDPNVVEIITDSLRSRGYVTESAYNGEDALRKYEDFKPDLVVLDVVLPGKNGLAVCGEIRARDVNYDVPVIMISANPIPDDLLETYLLGAQDFIRKPFSVKEILAKVDTFLSQACGRRDLREKNEILEDEVLKGQEDLKRVNRELKKKVFDMRTLFDLSQDLNRLRDPDDLVNVFFLTIAGQLGIGSLALFYARSDGDAYLTFAGGKGIRDGVLRAFQLSRAAGLSGHLLGGQEVVDLRRSALPGEARREASFMAGLGFHYCYPLVVKSSLVGVVFFGGKVSGQRYRANELEMFRSICSSAATGLENARLYQELQSTYLSTIKVLVSTIEAKDAYTRGHTDRVALFARMIAEEMQLERKDLETVSFGATLHDIGKLGVYEDILNKPGELTDGEWKIVRSHPEVGANIIRNMKFLESACDLVRHHHERLDGRGYPDGLKGKEISIGARIVAVADSFDAMTSDRPYRQAFSYQEAIEQLRMQTDKFDSDVIEHLVRLIEAGRIRGE
ncbi:MAG: response regulator [Candidatus Krumholzibacteria bacterium]|nr:response regulator [Candidatus Krumholzibacteria bacterium]